MYCDKIYFYKYMEEDVEQTAVKYYKNANSSLAKIEGNIYGSTNCDEKECVYSLDYLKYVNYLIKKIRG